MGQVLLTDYAVKRFLERSTRLGLNGSVEKLKALLSVAVPERLPKNRRSRLHLLKRRLLRDRTLNLVASGWRFVIWRGKLVTSERVRPHENYSFGEDL